MKKLFISILMLLLLTGCDNIAEECSGVACNVSYDVTYKTIKAENIEENFIIIDVRSIDEFKEGHIKGAINIEDFNDVEFSIDQVIVVYCNTGITSKVFCEDLISKGFVNVYDLGSISNWDGTIVKSLY